MIRNSVLSDFGTDFETSLAEQWKNEPKGSRQAKSLIQNFGCHQSLPPHQKKRFGREAKMIVFQDGSCALTHHQQGKEKTLAMTESQTLSFLRPKPTYQDTFFQQMKKAKAVSKKLSIDRDMVPLKNTLDSISPRL